MNEQQFNNAMRTRKVMLRTQWDARTQMWKIMRNSYGQYSHGGGQYSHGWCQYSKERYETREEAIAEITALCQKHGYINAD
jgi:hypothetical protein